MKSHRLCDRVDFVSRVWAYSRRRWWLYRWDTAYPRWALPRYKNPYRTSPHQSWRWSSAWDGICVYQTTRASSFFRICSDIRCRWSAWYSGSTTFSRGIRPSSTYRYRVWFAIYHTDTLECAILAAYHPHVRKGIHLAHIRSAPHRCT